MCELGGKYHRYLVLQYGQEGAHICAQATARLEALRLGRSKIQS